MFLVDSHCHLNQLNYKDVHKSVPDVLNKARKKGVQLILSVSVSLSDYDDMIKCIGYRKDVVFSCGIHPLYLHDFNQSERNRLYDLSCSKNVVAIGETGLDFYRLLNNKKQQIYVFREHINIAKALNKPIIVHSRNASKDTIMVLESEEAIRCGGVLHCFSEDIDIARSLLNLNFYISFSGIITLRNTYMFQQVIKYIPLDRILLETDSPYLTPIAYKGEENQPAYIYEIARNVALIKNITMEQLACSTTTNFWNLFKMQKEK